MLLVCPSCNTRYVVPDAAIGFDGRQVRCANCKHSWFQNGATLPVAEPVAAAPAIAAPSSVAVEAPPVAKPPETPAPTPTPPPPAPPSWQPTEPAADIAVPQQPSFAAFENTPATAPSFAETPPPPPMRDDYVDDRSQFAHEPPFKPRRNPAKLWTMAGIAFAAFVALGGVALWQFGIPTDSFSLAIKEPDLKIVLNENLTTGKTADGTPYFIASGSIVNPSADTQKVPDMLVTLKDAGGRSVYSWKMKPKSRSLSAGGKIEFSELKLDVPLAASRISVGWALDGE